MLVRKKDGGLWVCVDFRELNAETVSDVYPIPRIAETLEALHGAKWFCSLDLQSGYLQVGMCEANKPKTAMTTPFGLYEFNKMPFGLTNTPATFQRLMERCIAGLNLKICLVYLDDIIVFGGTFEETLKRLEIVLEVESVQMQALPHGVVIPWSYNLRPGVSPDPDKIRHCKNGFSIHQKCV